MFPLSLNQPVLLYKIEESLGTDEFQKEETSFHFHLYLCGIWNKSEWKSYTVSG